MLNVQLTDINCLISLVWLGEVEVDSSILTETTNDLPVAAITKLGCVFDHLVFRTR